MSDDEGTNAVEDAPSDETRDAAGASGDPGMGTDRESDPEELVERAADYDEELAADVEAVIGVDRRDEELDSLQERLEEREAEIEELESKLKRKQADFQNYKKRAEKRREQVEERATEDLVGRLVGVRDDLKRALEEESGDVEALREGVEMTVREFDRLLEDEGVAEIDPDPGSDVDPQRHQVMVRVESDRPEGTVDEVFAAGYEMGEKVIREAQVTVSDGSGDGGD
ncbi:nucleotide exchange factor GrpE [Saliphagus sp. LR7]|uniref:nucleotide exchange factor GrpE n=1 Tax=Saliphagus sp. LR7 TaxID=2282654 RepID=UPI000DF7B266|nr:nucleotide exchange factor GrpE [Saliphagus sp. LR7]